MEQKPYTAWAFDVDRVERWAYNKNLFTSEECTKIIEYCKSYNLNSGTVISDNSDDKIIDNSIRTSNVVFIQPVEEFQWVYRRLTDAIVDLNTKYFNFDLYGLTESLQFSEYNSPGGKYDAHIDKLTHGVIRKLSIVLQLSDPSTYTGGEFQLLDNGDPETLQKEQGTLLVFPSYTLHRVCPVTSNVRYSLVGWVSGKQFK